MYVPRVLLPSLPSFSSADLHAANTDAGSGLDTVAPGSNVAQSIAPGTAASAAPPATNVAPAASYDSDSSDDVDIIMDQLHGAPAAAAAAGPVSAYAALVPGNIPPGAVPPGMVSGGPAGVFGPVVVTDPAVNEVGQAYVVTPDHDLHVPAYFWPPGPKYYAVTRGRYVGVFNSSALFTMAICGVSSPVARATRDLHEALDFFNTARTANMLDITG
ncbi:hypothetical protein GGF50DRAFT_131723 [Schizophyllum commune]